MIKLVCTECRHENEPERIYCHQCGARLDRSGLAKVKTKEEDPRETQRRVRSLLDGRRALARHRFFQMAKLILAAFAAAVLVQMLRQPDLPPPPTSPLMPMQINLDLEAAVTRPGSAPLRYSDEQVNAYLDYSLRGKRVSLSRIFDFERALVAFDEGAVRIAVERSLFGWPIVTTSSYAVSIDSDGIKADALGGSIGRLAIHPALMQYVDIVLSDVWGALDRERKLVAKLNSIEFHPQSVFLIPPRS